MNPLSEFDRQQYISVETYRKSGEGVRTPVWFVAHAGELCFTTEASSGKVKRLRRNPEVKVAPCTASGEPRGGWHPARACFLSAEEAAAVKSVYARKYGVQKLFFDLMGIFRRTERVFIALKVEA